MKIQKLKEFHSRGAALMRRGFERPLYTLGIQGYRGIVALAGKRNPKAAKLTRGQQEVWSILDAKIDPESRYIWIHAASLGEFEQGRPLIERLKEERPEYKILLTFFSPSGYEVRKNFPLADCVCYLPFDTPSNVRRFLDKVNPEMAVFVKYEIWRNYLEELHNHRIPTYLISAVFRPDQKFFRKSSAWYGKWLRWFSRIFVQDRRSAELLRKVGIEDAVVAGDTRFDRVSAIRSQGKEIPELERFRAPRDGKSPAMTFMVGSSWPADEDVYADWVKGHPEVRTVIAPHEFDDARLKALKERFGEKCVLMSEARKDPALLDTANVLIIDCFGLLSSAYAYCDMAYVGGAFGAGLHNINEAAVYDVPVIYGPNNTKFIEAREMAEAGGGYPIKGKKEFEKTADGMLSYPEQCKESGRRAGDYIRSKIGATDMIFCALFGEKS